MNPRVIDVKPLDNYYLLIQFSNGEWREFDVNPFLEKGIFKELKSKAMFWFVNVVDGTVQWANEADFCPDTLFLESSKVH